MKEAMELLSKAFDTLNNTLVLGSEAGKISVVKAQMQKAYEILHREAEEQEKDKRELVALKYQLEDAKKKAKKVKDGEAETAKAPEESEVTDG